MNSRAFCFPSRTSKVLFAIFTLVYISNLSIAQKVSPGTFNTLWICEDGTLTGSGTNTYGTMCDENYIQNTLPPPQLGNDDDWLMIACGTYHTLLLKEDHTLWACGSNASGELGIGDLPNQLNPVQVGNDDDWVFIEAGEYCSYGIREDGTLWSWGSGIDGSLGLGFEVFQSNVPLQVGLETDWQTISVQNKSCIALRSEGELWCWGENSDGQLGIGNFTDTYIPTYVQTNNPISVIGSGGAHTFVIDEDHRAYACGNNMDGKFGIGAEPMFSNVLMAIDSLNQYIDVACGGSFNILLRDDGTLWSAGTNVNGQLGIGSFESVNVLTQIGSDNDWETVEAGAFHAVAYKTDESYRIWGYNQYLQLGVPSCDGNNSCNSPQEIDGLCGSSTMLMEEEMLSFTVYPNPVVNDQLQIDLSRTHGDLLNCVMWDMMGRKIYEAQFRGRNSLQIDLPNLNAGVYIIKLQTANGEVARKTFIVE